MDQNKGYYWKGKDYLNTFYEDTREPEKFDKGKLFIFFCIRFLNKTSKVNQILKINDKFSYRRYLS